MLIMAALYAVLIWLRFSKLELIGRGRPSGALSPLIGIFILAASANYLTPSGSFVIVSRIVEVTPNVSGQIVDTAVRPNLPVRADPVLLRIDPTPRQPAKTSRGT